MPPVRHRLLGCAPENTWQVGSDDFAVPALLAIVSRLILLGLTVGTIVYLLFPAECEDDSVPPLFYISFCVFNLVLFLSIINEGVIFSLSMRGRIHDTNNSRKYFPYALEVRVVGQFVELLTVIAATIGVFHPKYGGEAITCDDVRDGPLIFAKVIVSLMWLLWILLVLGLFFAVDPVGFCSPSAFGEIVDRGELGDELDEEGFILPGKFDDPDGGTEKLRKRKYHVELGHRKMFRRFKVLCCCFGHRGSSNRSTSLAMQDAAKAFHTVFSDLDFVASDVVAGLILLKKDQKRKKMNCGCAVCVNGAEGSCQCLTQDLRDLTFEHMPESQKTNYVRHEQRPFNFHDPVERCLFEDMVYYMHYCMGIYGWTLHVFQNPLTGLCSLSAVTCCKCHFRCVNPRAGEDFVKDDICLCGIGTIRVQSKRQEEDIVFVTYENEVFQAPFSISVDHDQKTVVIAVRGTLSMKDALTDMSVTMVKVKIPGLESDDLYMHNGMYRTAQWIKGRIHTRRRGELAVLTTREANSNPPGMAGVSASSEEGQILRATMERHWNYRLIVTGHSLGGGVAAILAVLLRPAYPHLHCYSFSPPGCIFSMPVAQYSESFITTVVLGNDLVIRTSFRSLLYLKKQTEYLVKNCKKPKPQVLFPQSCWNVFSKVKEDPTVSLEDVKEHLIPDRRQLGIRGIVAAKRFARKAKQRIRRKGTIHVYIRNINQGDHIASFPPGRVLHMEFTKNAKPLCLGLCYPNEMKLTWKSFEDFSAIAVDKGMVEDHLPTAVMAGLKRIRRQFIHSQFDTKETERIRMNTQEKYRQMVEALRRDERVNGHSERVKDYTQRGGDVENQRKRVHKGGLGMDTNPNSVTVAVTLEEASYYGSEDDTQVDDGRNADPPTTNTDVNDKTSTSNSAAAVAKMFVKTLQKSSVQTSTSTTTTAAQQKSGEIALEMEAQSSSPTSEELTVITSLPQTSLSHLV